jgi:hypothetical protein
VQQPVHEGNDGVPVGPVVYQVPYLDYDQAVGDTGRGQVDAELVQGAQQRFEMTG